MRIEGINPIGSVNGAINKTDHKQDFARYLSEAVNRLDELQKQADISSINLAMGDAQNIHQVMIDSEKAAIALQFTLQIRNKILDAYQEIMRMQV